MEKIVIAGSASLQDRVLFWKKYFEDKDCEVLAYPNSISKEVFMKEYPEIHKNFFRKICDCDTLFIMNEDKNGVEGYIGAETFAELVFGVMQNLNYNSNIDVVILKMPSKDVQCFDEINLWLKLGWVKLFDDFN